MFHVSLNHDDGRKGKELFANKNYMSPDYFNRKLHFPTIDFQGLSEFSGEYCLFSRSPCFLDLCQKGYDSIWRKRPRASSADGCCAARRKQLQKL